jgi:hypothetical protein
MKTECFGTPLQDFVEAARIPITRRHARRVLTCTAPNAVRCTPALADGARECREEPPLWNFRVDVSIKMVIIILSNGEKGTDFIENWRRRRQG